MVTHNHIVGVGFIQPYDMLEWKSLPLETKRQLIELDKLLAAIDAATTVRKQS